MSVQGPDTMLTSESSPDNTKAASYSPEASCSSQIGTDDGGFEHECALYYTAMPTDASDDDMGNDADLNSEDEPENDDDNSCLSQLVLRLQFMLSDILYQYFDTIRMAVYLILTAAYLCYFIYAMDYKFGDEGSLTLLVITVLCTMIVIFNLVRDFINSKEKVKSRIDDTWTAFGNLSTRFSERFRISIILNVFLVLGFVVYLSIEVAPTNPRNLISLCGVAFFILVLYIFSYEPSKVKWRPVYRGIALQIMLALLLLKTRWGYDAFHWFGNLVTSFLAFTDAGSKFVFGDHYENNFFVFKVLPVIVFFSTFVSIMYYLGVVQGLVTYLGRFLAYSIGTSPVESVNAAANIFLGQSECPLLLRPYLKDATNSELHAIMTGGFATIAGSVLAAYIMYGIPANHLLIASVMSAPAALCAAKLFVPETEKTKQKRKSAYEMPKAPERNIIEAASNGATVSINMIAQIVVNLIAFIALLEFLNSILLWCGRRVGCEGLTFQRICSYVLWPVAFLLGANKEDCFVIAELIGIKTGINEFVAYVELSKYIGNRKTFNEYLSNATENVSGNLTGTWYFMDGDVYLNDTGMRLEKGLISERSVVIATYALCGFANLTSMGIQLGTIGALVPSRKSDLSQFVFRAMIAGNVACMLTACIAGLLYIE